MIKATRLCPTFSRRLFTTCILHSRRTSTVSALHNALSNTSSASGLANRPTVIKKPPFRIDEKGWGEFDMTIVLSAIGKGGDHTLDHDLNFQAERYEAKHQVVSTNCMQPHPARILLIHNCRLSATPSLSSSLSSQSLDPPRRTACATRTPPRRRAGGTRT